MKDKGKKKKGAGHSGGMKPQSQEGKQAHSKGSKAGGKKGGKATSNSAPQKKETGDGAVADEMDWISSLVDTT